MSKKEIRDWIEASGQSSTKGRARTKEQYTAMARAEEENICLFCHPERWENGPLITGEYWIVKLNDYPYKDHQLHLVVIWQPNHHLEDIQTVPDRAWMELDMLISWVESTYRLPAINFVMRFGDQALRSSTIHHLHGHIQIPSESMLPEAPPLTINWRQRPLILHSGHYAIVSLNPEPHQQKFAILQNTGEKSGFFGLMTSAFGALHFIQDQKIQGGGIAYRRGNRRYTNAKFEEPHITIYAPDGTGRVQATFIPPAPGQTKPICKATFCKGFEGEELEVLKKRMREFTER